MSWLFTRNKEEEPTSKIDSSELQVPTEATASDILSGSEFDPAKLHPLADLDKPLDYLLIEEDALSTLPGDSMAIPSRGWQDDLCYGTGTSYLSGLAIGGLWGLNEGMKKTKDITSTRLRLNGILNGVTRRGPFVGNSLGVLALVYNGINSLIGYKRQKHGWENSVAAGALTGALYKSTRGLRAMAISSSLVATAAGIWTLAKRSFTKRLN
ncbi:Mitochondrial import inner membrane translocase subunit tim23 [Schizosaccharomyces pombe]|uniref:Mitochondrial import inner membrane translocase subunit tim23 n=1 Tax=Schizosaccharomyces pombe (strain 972 / ATCC 24843) TaxID=284812 RepID=TIM23_SCHPO|nr:putative TIM23 translocase complex subunit Tim23 [Schizosaccharomyces pombe]Q9USM7.1 RecName: Full=Mitochondrial import inner membrane translocase subunit tim23 [Schizosaccharomyces pombe 972h-]CAB53081.1 TIM23 translocase complex subunit Tim23 (predicted) [Schizosaccharomyces pombe]|eukprot:NP_587996.1 putative TIM23 translocase complex subunit Tim23 [Schizosaccharomyces pombe]